MILAILINIAIVQPNMFDHLLLVCSPIIFLLFDILRIMNNRGGAHIPFMMAA